MTEFGCPEASLFGGQDAKIQLLLLLVAVPNKLTVSVDVKQHSTTTACSFGCFYEKLCLHLQPQKPVTPFMQITNECVHSLDVMLRRMLPSQ